MFRVKKTYGHDLGWSTTFRQWKATSHCSNLHGYALGFTLEFESESLDLNNWVIDFGGLNQLKTQFAEYFDHTTLISADDPELSIFQMLAEKKLIRLRVMPLVSCESFAKFAFELTSEWLKKEKLSDRVRLISVEVKEHGANSAIYSIR